MWFLWGEMAVGPGGKIETRQYRKPWQHIPTYVSLVNTSLNRTKIPENSSWKHKKSSFTFSWEDSVSTKNKSNDLQFIYNTWYFQHKNLHNEGTIYLTIQDFSQYLFWLRDHIYNIRNWNTIFFKNKKCN